MSSVLSDERDGALWLTIDREDSRNALDDAVLSDLRDGFEAARHDGRLRAVVLTGAGDKAFSAGGNLRKDAGSPFAVDFSRVEHGLVNLFGAMNACLLPIIARVNGHALGGGLGLVAASDIAVAVGDAKFGTPEVNIGVFPMVISPYLRRLMPRRRFVQMALLGETFTAQEALVAGLVTSVTSRGRLDEEVEVVLSRLGAVSPTAVRLGKFALGRTEDLSLADALEFSALMLDRVAQTRDAAEGFAAFREKRAPQWTGE